MAKSGIVRRTVLPSFVFFFVLLSIFFVGSYRYISGRVMENSKKSLRQTLDLVRMRLDATADPREYAEAFRSFGIDMCTAFGIDYMSMFVPDAEKDIVEYVVIACDPRIDPDGMYSDPERVMGVVQKYKLTSEELAVWKGEKRECYVSYDNKYEFAFAIASRETDPSGRKVMVTVEKSYADILNTVKRFFFILTVSVLVVYACVCAVLYVMFRRNISVPANALANAMDSYVAGGARTCALDVGRNDEFGVINRAFDNMTAKIEENVRSISALSEERERHRTEMSVASKIQMGFLPPANADFEDCEIRAMVSPAREVGGDLYDYVRLDDGRIFVMIADVSGKGVSASLFMAATMMLMHQSARLGLSPAGILERTNGYLCEKNPSSLFVTAFVGIYDGKAGTLNYSNAGHNVPYFLSDGIRLLDGGKGLLLGLFEGETYEDASVVMNPGDCVYMYTDGLSESVNSAGVFYGMGRLEETLRRYHPTERDSLLGYMEDSVREFSSGAEQSDDITMLSLTAKERTELFLDADPLEFSKIKSAVMSVAIPDEIRLSLCLAAEEIFVNICMYAFGECGGKDEKIRFELINSDYVQIILEDGGMPYNPLEDVLDISGYDIDAQAGGLGKFIAFSVSDAAQYRYEDGKNTLTLTKYKEKRYDC